MDIKKEIHSILSNVDSNVHYEINRDNDVEYPYTTYTLTFERVDMFTEGVYIDLQVFDHSTSLEGVYSVEENLKSQLNNLVKETEHGFLTFKFNRSHTVPTGDETIMRLDIQLYAYVNRFEIEQPRVESNG